MLELSILSKIKLTKRFFPSKVFLVGLLRLVVRIDKGMSSNFYVRRLLKHDRQRT